MKSRSIAAFLLAAVLSSHPARADEALVTFRIMELDTAQELARAALGACRKEGFQVSVAVVDRFGTLQVLLKDRFAGSHTPETARRKAWTAISFRADTLELSEATRSGSPQSAARDIPGALMLGGGVPVEAAGSIVGGVGISGAPGGQQDDACARAGIEAIQDKISF